LVSHRAKSRCCAWFTSNQPNAAAAEVARTREPVAISKQGRTVVIVARPHTARGMQYPQQALRGSGRTCGNIVSAALLAEAWDVLAGQS